MKSKDIISSCLLFALIVLIVVGVFLNFRYIVSLENQVYQRDSLIRELSFSDKLVREFFDIHIDSLNHSRSYTLKDDKKTRIVESREPIVEIDGKRLNFEQFYKEYINLIHRYNALVNEYNTLIGDFGKSNSDLIDYRQSIITANRKIDSLQTLLQEKQYYLNSISNVYGVVCKTNREGNTIHYSIKGSPQLDSALRIYPYFKDLAVYDEKRDVWKISIPNKKRIDTIVEISYKRSTR